MKILTYIQTARTFVPTTGVGKHINNMVRTLSVRPGISLELLTSAQFVDAQGQLDRRSPLQGLPVRTFPMRERLAERLWKALSWPSIDRYAQGFDWVYSPADAYLPLKTRPFAVTIQDIQAFESDLPWSRTFRHRLLRWRWSMWVPRLLRHARLVLTGSEFSKSRMVDLLGADPGKIRVVGNGVEAHFFTAEEIDLSHQPRPCPQPYLFVIGGLMAKKGGQQTLRVADALRRRGSDLQIVVAGSNEPKLARQAGEHPNVRLLGMVPDEALPALLRAAVALLFLTLYEGFGIPVLEAMATRTPVIASNRSSLPEVVGDAGFLVDVEDSNGIADLARQLERDRSSGQELTDKGLRRARQFSWIACVERLEVALRELS